MIRDVTSTKTLVVDYLDCRSDYDVRLRADVFPMTGNTRGGLAEETNRKVKKGSGYRGALKESSHEAQQLLLARRMGDSYYHRNPSVKRECRTPSSKTILRE